MKQSNSIQKNIKYSNNLRLEGLNRIIFSERMVGIFGAGGYAYTLIDELSALSIQVNFCVVDDDYYQDGLLCNGIQVVSVSECNKTKNGAILIIGFGMNYHNEDAEKTRIRYLINNSIDIIDFEDQFVSSFYYMDYSFVLRNSPKIQELYDSFEDELSKRLLIDYINGRLSGNMSCLRDYQNTSLYDYSLELLFQKKSEKGIILDCGAFDGISAVQVRDYLGDYNKIIAFECDEANYRKLLQNVSNFENIISVKKGVWNHTEILTIVGEGQEARIREDISNNICRTVEMVALDDYVEEPVSAILMDIEGSEYNALQGAKRLIESFQPVLAVRMYHKMEDFIQIQPLIDSFNVTRRYRYYLRYNGHYRGAADLTLYAI